LAVCQTAARRLSLFTTVCLGLSVVCLGYWFIVNQINNQQQINNNPNNNNVTTTTTTINNSTTTTTTTTK